MQLASLNQHKTTPGPYYRVLRRVKTEGPGSTGKCSATPQYWSHWHRVISARTAATYSGLGRVLVAAAASIPP